MLVCSQASTTVYLGFSYCKKQSCSGNLGKRSLPSCFHGIHPARVARSDIPPPDRDLRSSCPLGQRGCTSGHSWRFGSAEIKSEREYIRPERTLTLLPHHCQDESLFVSMVTRHRSSSWYSRSPGPIPGLQKQPLIFLSSRDSAFMASEKKLQLQRERTVSATRSKPSLLTSTKAPTARGRVLPSGRDTLSAKEMGEKGSVSGSHKPAKESKAGETEVLQKNHLRSSSCGDLQPETSQAGSQKKRPHKVGSFGSTSHGHSKASAVGGQKHGSSTTSTTLPGSRTARTLSDCEGKAKGERSSSGKNSGVESADGGASSTKSATLSRLERQVLVSENW